MLLAMHSDSFEGMISCSGEVEATAGKPLTLVDAEEDFEAFCEAMLM
jgi:hypothetical protein